MAEDARQNILNREIHHRMKNTLAMVQALAQQTLRGVSERDAVATLEQRLFALGKAHDVLLRNDWEAASLSGIVAEAIGGAGPGTARDGDGRGPAGRPASGDFAVDADPRTRHQRDEAWRFVGRGRASRDCLGGRGAPRRREPN